ncbi:protein-L-isoaspartate O-methyltransferase [Streptomyces sp. NBC_00868]|uniref:methyltransferase domain-containing protein n=1 Tax=unclassified Streptomyces TaxID=2593676 RepID=UPI00324B9923|nr:protein-L-isoaspartate O-methyltransferase [Streptomyces sp. NBC_00868]
MHLDDRRRELAEAMETQGLWPADSPWVRRAILDTVPRHQFAPDRLWTWNGHDQYVPVDRGRDQDAWADLVYAGPEDSAITQILDGLPSSSLSCVAVVADMLDSLILEPGHRVLEVGTGAGWNAGLLAARAGAGLVTSVEVDAGLAAAADRRLTAAGLDVAVHAGDGNAGWPGAAPYDRLIATYAVDDVPWTWVEQTRPGGRLVIPWGRLGHVALTVADDGKSATGWVQGLGMFMPSRGIDQGREHHAIRGNGPPGRPVHVERDLRPFTDPHLVFALRVSHPDIRIATEETEDGLTVRLHDGVSSWATATTGQTGTTAAYEGGPRQLLVEVETGRQHWEGRDTPPLWDFGMTVTPEGLQVWSGTAHAGPYMP